MKNFKLLIPRNDRKFILILGSIILLAFFPFANPNAFSIDDYNLFYISFDENHLLQFYTECGRWVIAFMTNLFGKFVGESGFKGIYLAYFMLFAQMIYGGYLIAKQFKLDTQLWYTPIIISIGFIHIFCAEILTFKFGVVNISYSLLYFVAFSSWFIIKDFNYKFIIGIVGFLVAFATYQVILNILLVLTIAGLLIETIDNIKNQSKIDFKSIIKSEYIVKLLGLAVGLISYLIINKLILNFLNISISNRSTLLAFDKIPSRIKDTFSVFKMVLIDKNAYLIPYPTKILTLVIVVLALIIGLIIIIRNQSSLFKRVSASFLFVFGLGATLLFTALASLLLEIWWMVPRVFTGYGFFVMLCFILVIKFVSNSILKNLFIVILIAVSFSFISVNHNIANDQAYLNQLDRNRAQRLLVDLEKIDSFKTKKTFLYQRPNCWANEYHIKTMYGDMNISAFCTSWSKYELMQFVAGYPLNKTSEEENLAIIKSIETQSDSSLYHWSEKRGVYTKNDFIYIFP